MTGGSAGFVKRMEVVVVAVSWGYSGKRRRPGMCLLEKPDECPAGAFQSPAVNSLSAEEGLILFS